MEYLARSQYCLLSLSDAVRRLASREPMPDRSVVVTLDDGFVDNYEHALPILRRSGVPATVFLTVSYIGTDRLPTLSRTDFVPRPLSWEQVREMHRAGIEFGSHTLTHPMLSEVPLNRARLEIAESRRRIESLGVPVSLFCYPRRLRRPGQADRPRRGLRRGLQHPARSERPERRSLRASANLRQPARHGRRVHQEGGRRIRRDSDACRALAPAAAPVSAAAPPLTSPGAIWPTPRSCRPRTIGPSRWRGRVPRCPTRMSHWGRERTPWAPRPGRESRHCR